MDRGESLECVSLCVTNSNDVWWIDQPQLVKGLNYTIEVVKNESHNLEDGYHRLKLNFLNERKDIFEHFQQILDDTRRRTLCYYLTFECGARFDKDILLHESNITVDFEGEIISL